MNDLLRRPM